MLGRCGRHGVSCCALSPCGEGSTECSTYSLVRGQPSPHPIRAVETAEEPSPDIRAFTPVFAGYGERHNNNRPIRS